MNINLFPWFIYPYICARMQEKEGEILEEVGKLFMRYGIKSVTMDDVAKGLKISKKTLYKYVKDKHDLVIKVMEGHCEHEKTITNKIISENENAIDELIGISKHVSKDLAQIHPSIHFDLEKYYPEAWKVFQTHKAEHIYTCIVNNMNKGIAQGLYRNNLNTSILARLYISRIDALFDPEVFAPNEFSFPQVHAEMMEYHIFGIASDKGIKYFQEKVKREKLVFHL